MYLKTEIKKWQSKIVSWIVRKHTNVIRLLRLASVLVTSQGKHKAQCFQECHYGNTI